jgi:5-methylcytosine-specific restriction enzyme A
MGLQDLTKPAVEEALREFQKLGRENFLRKYGFGKARQFYVEHEGLLSDSKAIAGAAHGKLPGQRPITASEFRGKLHVFLLDPLPLRT